MTAPARRQEGQVVLAGVPGAPGVGQGPIVHLPPPVPPDQAIAVAGPPAVEQARLVAALAAAAEELDELAAATGDAISPEIGAIFQAQALFARDSALIEPAMAAIATDGVTAASAFLESAETQAAILAALDDDYFRERATDVRDVARRVVARLEGRPQAGVALANGSPAVIASEDLDASVVATLRPRLVAAIALSGGARTGHAAIVARALGIPLVLGLGDALTATIDGAPVLVDGGTGELVVDPLDGELERRRAPRLTIVGPRGPAATAARAATVHVEANVGSVAEAEQAAAAGADAIGLMRTELLVMGRAAMPGLDEQRSVYRRIQGAMAGRRVVFRTFDIGGDKPFPGTVAGPAEPNPALGIRGIRLGLRDPERAQVQLRALLESAADGELSVMFPMVSTLEEIKAARAALQRAAEASVAAGRPVASVVRIGMMIEVPAAALMLDVLAPAVDFLSIGTNDLTQYVMAADRIHPGLAPLTSPFQPAVLRLVAMTVKAAHAHGRPVAVCGEAAADPLVAPILAGLGVDALSVAPSGVAMIRDVVGRVSDGVAETAGLAVLEAATAEQVEAIARDLAASTGD